MGVLVDVVETAVDGVAVGVTFAVDVVVGVSVVVGVFVWVAVPLVVTVAAGVAVGAGVAVWADWPDCDDEPLVVTLSVSTTVTVAVSLDVRPKMSVTVTCMMTSVSSVTFGGAVYVIVSPVSVALPGPSSRISRFVPYTWKKVSTEKFSSILDPSSTALGPLSPVSGGNGPPPPPPEFAAAVRFAEPV